MVIRLRLTKYWQIAVAVLAVLIGSGWYLLNGVTIANFQPVMKLRQFYYFKLPSSLHLKTSRLPFSVLPVQTVKVSQAETSLYVYAFFGKFEQLDAAKGSLYLKDKHNRVYSFKYALLPQGKNSPSGLAYYQTVDGQQSVKFLDVTSVAASGRQEVFSENDILLIYWADERTLGEILDFAGVHPENQLNQNNDVNHYQQIILTNK